MECRILENYLFMDSVSVAASSQNPEFPATNIKSPLRSKVWRSSGTFIIAAGNCKIDFKEAGGGPQLTATLSSGTYSQTTLAAEIKTKLESAGSKHYSCSFSTTTGKWSIATTDGAYLSLLWQSGTHTASSVGSSLGFSIDCTGALTYAAPAIAVHTEESVVVDLKTACPVDSFALFFDPMRTIPFTSNAQLWVQANATDSWDAPALSQAVTVDWCFRAASHFWNAPQVYRYWRLKVIDPRNPNLFAELAQPVLANSLQLARLPRNGFSVGTEDQSVVERTKYGHEYADLYPLRRTLEFEYFGLSYADANAIESLFGRVGRAVPFVVAHDPTGTIYDPDHFLIYGKFKENLKARHINGALFGMPVAVLEAF